jgi:hypothetical protein
MCDIKEDQKIFDASCALLEKKINTGPDGFIPARLAIQKTLARASGPLIESHIVQKIIGTQEATNFVVIAGGSHTIAVKEMLQKLGWNLIIDSEMGHNSLNSSEVSLRFLEEQDFKLLVDPASFIAQNVKYP